MSRWSQDELDIIIESPTDGAEAVLKCQIKQSYSLAEDDELLGGIRRAAEICTPFLDAKSDQFIATLFSRRKSDDPTRPARLANDANVAAVDAVNAKETARAMAHRILVGSHPRIENTWPR